MEQNPIKYSDLISPDDSIEKLIQQLTQLNEAYTNMSTNVKQQAQELSDSLKKVSGATEEGRKKTKETSEDAKRLEKAYKGLEQAVSKNAKEIARLNQVKREMNNYNKQVIRLNGEEIQSREQIAKASYNQLSAQYALNKAYINSLSATDRQIKKNRELIQTTKAIYDQMKKLQADTGKMQLNVGNYPQFNSAQLMGMMVGVTGAAGAALAAINALKDGVGVAMDYEHSLSVLASILSTTKDKLGELSEQARDLGATTIFTASEVVQLQTELAKLGYTTEDIINMTPGVLSFAQATGSSLADAASLTGATIRMFGKEAKDTQEVVDKMTASTTKSALSFSYLNNAMSTVGPVANAFDFKLEEVLALLGQLANAGFDASSAATATRNILLNLADANGKLAKALGAPVTDLNSLIAGLKKLDERGIDLAETLELTDKRSVSAFNTFLSGTDTVIDLRDALLGADGAAAQMAKTMGDDLSGDVKTLQSAWQDFMIELNNGQGLLRNTVQLLTNVVRLVDKPFKWFNERTERKRKEAQSRHNADYYANVDIDSVDRPTFDIFMPNEGGTPASTGGGKSTPKRKLSEKELKKQQREAEKRKREAEKAIREQEKQQKDRLELRRKYEDTLLEIIEDAQVKERTKTIYHYDRQIEDLTAKMEKDVSNRKMYADMIAALEEAKNTRLAQLVEENAKKQQEKAEKQKHTEEQKRQQNMRLQEQAIRMEHDIQMDEIEMLDTSEKEKTRLRLEAEKERLKKLMALYMKNGKTLEDVEVRNIQSQINAVDNAMTKNQKHNNDIYDVLGFKLSDEKKEAINEAFSYAMDNLNSYIDAWVQAADKKREAADKDVESTKNALDAEIEARNKGYASSVETARKEYEQAKKNQEKAIREQEKAQKAQEAVQTMQQIGNLVTATSMIWSQLGFPWAIPAIAVMWGSFAAAKIKAVQVAQSGTEQYGEGTVELLQGGSHQSGNDIDLGRKQDGTRRRAEGGEFFAVINKRNSRRYRKIIPEIIGALNNGTFAQKYMRAYDDGGVAVSVNGTSPDLSKLTDDVRLIREQGERTRTYDANGNEITSYKNLRRIIRR